MVGNLPKRQVNMLGIILGAWAFIGLFFGYLMTMQDVKDGISYTLTLLLAAFLVSVIGGPFIFMFWLSEYGKDIVILKGQEKDPTLWCNACKAKTIKQCDCGPIAENE